MLPNPNKIFPNKKLKTIINVKPAIKNKNIIVGDFTYFADTDFEKHVTHHYDFIGDKLIIGKFCQIAAGVNFVMNGANHQMNAVTTFPFYIFEGWKQPAPALSKLPLKGDTIIGNDVWIGAVPAPYHSADVYLLCRAGGNAQHDAQHGVFHGPPCLLVSGVEYERQDLQPYSALQEAETA